MTNEARMRREARHMVQAQLKQNPQIPAHMVNPLAHKAVVAALANIREKSAQ